jgi:hypothetical protein
VHTIANGHIVTSSSYTWWNMFIAEVSKKKKRKKKDTPKRHLKDADER